MATVTLVLGGSPFDGTEVDLIYDDVTLQATTLQFVVSNILGSPLTVNAVINSMGFTWQAPPSANPRTYTFSPSLQGTAVSSPKGNTVEFGITSLQFGTVGNMPVPGNQTIHV